MPDRALQFDFSEMRAFALALKGVKPVVAPAIRKIFKRGGNKFRNDARKALLFGQAISLPAKLIERGRRKAVRSQGTSAKRAQLAHIKARTGGKNNPFLVAYTSEFLTYHEKKIRRRFEAMFQLRTSKWIRQARAEVVRVSEKKVAAAIGLRSLGRRPG